MDIYTKLAQKTIEEYLIKKTLPDNKKLPLELLNQRSGCFVSLHEKDNNELRGCIGTIRPVYKNLGGEIITNAIEAAFHDPRFSPINKSELGNLKYSVDVLKEPEKILSQKDLDIKKYGVIVKSQDGLRTGLLLPDLEGVDNIETQIYIAKGKAGILPDEDVLLYRFTVERHE